MRLIYCYIRILNRSFAEAKCTLVGYANSIKLLTAFVFAGILFSVHISSAFGFATFAFRVGGPGTDDVWRSVEPSSEGGYIIAGNTDSFGAGGNDAWVIKLSENGAVDWQRTYGGTGGDIARSIKHTFDGGFVVAGLTSSFTSGKQDMWVLKFDKAGNMQWHKSYGGTGNDVAHAIEPTADGGYLVAGYTQSFAAQNKDYFVVKTDSTGKVEWAKRYGGTAADVIRFAKQTADGNYLVAGFTHSFGTNGDIMVLKLDTNGDIIWQKTYGGGKFEEPGAILEVPGGYIIMEQSNSFSSSTDGWIFKIDDAGAILWQKRIGGGSFDEISAARLTHDGGFIVAAETKSFGAVNEDFWVIKFDSAGNAQWQKRYGGSGVDEPEAIALTPEGGSIVVGTTRSFGAVGKDVWFLRLNANGDVAQCTTEVTANLETKATEAATRADPVDITTNSAAVTPKVKDGVALPGAASFANPVYQCGVNQFNIPPVALDDEYSTDEDQALNVGTLGVLANDSDLDGDSLTATLVANVEHGVLDLHPDGSFGYIPDPDFFGTDSFTYKANDGAADSNEATVTITVNEVNDAPTANDDSYETAKNTELAVAAPGVLGNDSDPDGDSPIAIQVSGPSHGSLSLNSDGSFTYAPVPDYSGSDSFTYKGNDGTLDSNTATVTITVTDG